MPPSLVPIKASQYRSMPWKNGGGTTSEIYIDPPEASVAANFSWRISLARIDSSGPFSRFPAYQRTIVQLSGPPLRLVHESGTPFPLAILEPYHFSGERETHSELEGGPCFDFNFMVDRNRRSELTIERCAPSEVRTFTVGLQGFIYLLEGRWRVEAGLEAVTVEPGDSLVINAAQISCRAEGPSLAILVKLLT